MIEEVSDKYYQNERNTVCACVCKRVLYVYRPCLPAKKASTIFYERS